MRVGILGASRNVMGGRYQYSLSVIRALLLNNRHEYYVFYTDPSELACELGNSKSIVIPQEESLGIRLCKTVTIMFNLGFPFGKYRIIKQSNLDLLVIPQSAGLAGCCLKIPYLVPVHDLMHKYYPDFPEYPYTKRIRRDLVYSKAAKNAVFTIVDSEQGKEDLIKFLKIKREKIRIIPFIPPPYVYDYKDITSQAAEELISKYDLPDKYIFYPSQFWFHKNHVRLLKALYLIRKEYQEEIPIVFVGSDKGSLGQVISVADELGMKEQVHYLGYVSDQEIVALYKKATALIFPSLFGPTNIPILEALVIGTPLACSNLFSMPEQVKDAGLLFNPFDMEDIAEKIYSIWNDEKLRQKLVENGYKKVRNLTFENYAKKWNEVIEEAFEVIGKRARSE